MAISEGVQSGLFTSEDQQLIRIPLRVDECAKSRRRRTRRHTAKKTRSKRSLLLWTTEEHTRFLEALEFYPSGPWKVIADHVGTRTARQVMTHAQKYRQKIERRRQKQDERSVDAACTTPQSQASDAPSSCSPMSLFSEPVRPLLEDAEEHAILLDFLDNFQPNGISQVDPVSDGYDRFYDAFETMPLPQKNTSSDWSSDVLLNQSICWEMA